MEIVHKHLDELYRAYATAVLEIDGEPVILVASEEKGYPCYMYSGVEFDKRESVWEQGGGCMSIIQIPGRKNEFLAIRDFYLKESPSKAKLVWGKYENGRWNIEDILYLPYLHRFDIYEKEGIQYFVGATIADDKDFKDDWSRPGSIYSARIPDNLKDGLELIKIKGDLYRNHGYYRANNLEGYFTSDEGIFKLTPNQDWSFEKIFEGPVGEVAVMDINRDGNEELITIEPFHGDAIRIYENQYNQYVSVFEFPHELDFGHALTATTLLGVPTFIGGIRRLGCELFIIQCIEGKYRMRIIDNGGPSNISVGSNEKYEFIVASNHTRNEAAVYLIRK